MLSRVRRRLARELRHRGDRQLRRARPERARPWLRASQRVDPLDFSVLRRIAEVETLCGAPEAAARAWAAAIQVRDDHPEPFARLAFHHAWAGELEAAARYGERCLALDPDRSSRHHRASGVESLLAHIARGPASEPRHRHVALCGTSYCGSTLTSWWLGSLPGVANAGETHWLVQQLSPEGKVVRVDFAGPDPHRPRCSYCGGPCAKLDLALSRSLACDPVDWFDRIADALGEPVLVSSDKNHSSMLALDPWLRFDAVVLFRAPLEAWASTRAKRENRYDVHGYLAHWDRAYRSLVHAMPNRGRKIVVDFEAFRRQGRPALETLCKALDLPTTIPADIVREQHALGGNVRVHHSLRSDEPVEMVVRDPVELPEAERRAVARYAERSEILARLRAEHARTFG